MKVIIIIVFALLSGWGNLQASEREYVSRGDADMAQADTVRNVKVEIKSMEDLQNLMKMLGGSGGNAANVKVTGISRIIETPEVKEINNKNLVVETVLLNDSATVVTLDVAKCKGKLSGVDTSAYLSLNGQQYKIKEISDVKLPNSGKSALKFNAKKNKLTLIFPSLGMAAMMAREIDLVLSKETDGVQIKGINMLRKASTAQ